VDYDYTMLLKAGPGAPRPLDFERKPDLAPLARTQTSKKDSEISLDLIKTALVAEAERLTRSVQDRLDDKRTFLQRGSLPDSRVYFHSDSEEEYEEEYGVQTAGKQAALDHIKPGTANKVAFAGEDGVEVLGEHKAEAETAGGKANNITEQKRNKKWGGLIQGEEEKEEAREEDENDLDVLDIGDGGS
jgi:hypothetical protein